MFPCRAGWLPLTVERNRFGPGRQLWPDVLIHGPGVLDSDPRRENVHPQSP